MDAPDAWLVTGAGCQYVSLLRESADAAAVTEGGAVVPLYRSPALTDAEREAVEWCVEMAVLHATDCEAEVAALRGLLERTK